ncbi:MAG TPA: chemotaxis protein CheA [Tepidisphaeraceae bacterium]|nr:chemotaxis protein CheA [Tepidisphaeraceae bacterium]
MSELAEIIERSAAAAVMADASDLPSVAQLHTLLTSVQASATDQAPIHSGAGRATKVLEQIVMGDAKDANAALVSVRQIVQELQQLVSGALPTSATLIEPVNAETQAPATAPAAVVAEDAMGEQPIKAEDIPLVAEFVGEAASHMDSAEASLLALEEQPGDPEHINSVFRAFHTIKGVAGFLNFRQIGALAHVAENLLDRARKGIAPLDDEAVQLVLNSVDTMRRMVAATSVAAQTNQPPAREETLESLLQSLGVKAGSVKQTSQSASPTPQVATQAKAAPAAPPMTTNSASTDNTVKVSTERLDSLINTVGELVIAQSMVSRDVEAGLTSTTQRLGRNMSHLGKITRSLQDLAMAMRMVPVQGVFQKMARLARDVARKAGKEIDFVQVGAETELDRNVVEAVSDPLVHMVRNAIDHGVELPDDRVKAGKPAIGKVQLKAYHKAGSVVIEISDDGRGLNKSKILAKAIACGIVKPGQEMSEEEIFRLVFHAGLSTAEKVTDISGRGVGMDVARKNVEALRGRIEISSVEGKGSVFTIRLPLTLAVIDGLVVRVGTERYIIPITSVERSFCPQSQQLSTVQSTGEVCFVRDRLIPVVRLHRVFAVNNAQQDPTQALLVIAQADQDSCCLMVDELVGQQQVVIKSLGEQLGTVKGISGGAILGDGNVSLILDVPGLINLAKSE